MTPAHPQDDDGSDVSSTINISDAGDENSDAGGTDTEGHDINDEGGSDTGQPDDQGGNGSDTGAENNDHGSPEDDAPAKKVRHRRFLSIEVHESYGYLQARHGSGEEYDGDDENRCSESSVLEALSEVNALVDRNRKAAGLS